MPSYSEARLEQMMIVDEMSTIKKIRQLKISEVYNMIRNAVIADLSVRPEVYYSYLRCRRGKAWITCFRGFYIVLVVIPEGMIRLLHC